MANVIMTVEENGKPFSYPTLMNDLIVVWMISKKGTDLAGRKVLTFEIDGHTYSPEQILAFDEKEIRKTNSIPKWTCGDCVWYTGEECNGKHEGSEAYDFDEACDGFELIEPAIYSK